MAGQMNELLGDVAQQLHKLDERYLEVIQRVTLLEGDKEWTGEERRKVDKRLETGDHTFEAMRAELKEADRIARAALELAGKAAGSANRAWRHLEQLTKKKPETTIRKRIKDGFIEYGIKVAIGIALFAVYHILINGPRIAAAIKAAHDGGSP